MWSLWICRACGSAEPVDLQSLSIHGACGSTAPVDLRSLWICGACGSVEPVEPVDPWSLWIHGALWIHRALWICGARDPRSMHFRNVKQMTSSLVSTDLVI